MTIDRVDAPLKVAGAAPYPTDVTLPGMVHAVLVGSTIAAGRIRRISGPPSALAVITHENAPALAIPPMTAVGPAPRLPLQNPSIVHYGQPVAVVVAETLEEARVAARLVSVEYEETSPVLDIDDPRAEVMRNKWGLEVSHGDVTAALESAEVVYDETFTTSPVVTNPLGLFAAVASWSDDRLVVHASTQAPVMVQQTLAAAFGVSDVRVLVPYLGGGFGAGLRLWPHTVLAALAARVVGRPVKVVLTRPEMFTSVGHRPQSRQRLRLGATSSGRLVAIDQDAVSAAGVDEDVISGIVLGTPHTYDCPNVATHDRQVRLNIPGPGPMRGPGHAEGSFALESALDELSYRLGIDPIDLRLRNYADVHPVSRLPWSSNALRACYQVGAERFGWPERNPAPRSMRDGNWLIGYGMAAVCYSWYAPPCTASISIDANGIACVRSAATDIGTGTYTIATQYTASLLGLDVSQVRVEIGDSDLPPAPQSGGSGLATAFSSAIRAAARNLLAEFLDRSSLRGANPEEIVASDGCIHRAGDPSGREKYADILARHGLTELTAQGSVDLPTAVASAGVAPAGGFAAQFAEVRVDEDLGILRVTRVVSAVDGGRILNEKTARSQVVGATVMGIGVATLEEMALSPSGRVANATFADYLIPANADIEDMDVVFVGTPDTFNPSGTKGIGELGVISIAPAIANAVYHATGRRIRSLPITLEHLL